MSTIQFKDAKNYTLTADAMVIDDQLTSRIIMESIIKSIGDNVRVRSFDNALTALSVARQTPPDLIVVDYKMPEMNGVDFVKQIRQYPECADIPIVVFTIVDDKSVMYEALEAGATDFLTKPIDHYECKVRCRNLLTMRRQQIIIRERASTLETLVLSATHSIHVREKEALSLLTRITDIKGEYTGYHPSRIGIISRLIAQTLEMDEEFCEAIEISSPLHDIGEIRIPPEILLKNGPLTDHEMEIMKQHTVLGYDLLRQSSSSVLRFGSHIALNHHERYDGQGYPNRIEGKNIPISARIVSVADAFDSMTSPRPYRAAMSIQQAIDEIINNRGSQFDPESVDILIENIDKLPSINTKKIITKIN